MRILSRRRGKSESVYLPRELLKTRFKGYPYKRQRTATLFSVRRSAIVVLTLTTFEKLRDRGSTWLRDLQGEIRGENLLTDSYLSGTLSSQVFCMSTGRHWSLQKYLEVLLLPLTLWNHMWFSEYPQDDVGEAVYTISEPQISSLQKKFAHFDFTVSPSWVMHLIHTDPQFKDQLSDLIDGLNASDLLDLLHLNTLVIYDVPVQSTSQTSLRHVASECKRVCPAHTPRSWDYIEPHSGTRFQADGSLGFMLLEGKVQQLNRQFKGFVWNFPDYILKSYFSPDYLVKQTSVIEISVFACFWCQIVARHEKRVIAISPLLNLWEVLPRLSGEVIRLDPSFTTCGCAHCCKLRHDVSQHHSTLQCLAARAYKRNFTVSNHQSMSLIPTLIRASFLSRCADEV